MKKLVCTRPSITEAISDKIIATMLPEQGVKLPSLLDLGCGNAPRTAWIPANPKVFVDTTIPTRALPGLYIKQDALQYLCEGQGYSLIFALDFIEHLKKNQGGVLIKLLEYLATDMAVIFTPLGELCVDDSPGGHKCGWWPIEFFTRGWYTWEFPRFHSPWEDGKEHGAFYAIYKPLFYSAWWERLEWMNIRLNLGEPV